MQYATLITKEFLSCCSMTSVSTALVQGANRGLGLAFVKILAARGNNVVATCRHPEQADALQDISANVEVLQVDVTKENHIAKAANHVKEKYGSLDLLINNAGLLHPSGRGETRLSDVNMEDLQTLYAVNAAGPLIMARHFAPLLKKFIITVQLLREEFSCVQNI